MLKKITPEQQGILFMVLCACLWSIGGIFIKLVPWNASVIAGCRSLISSTVMLAYMKATGMKLKITRRVLISGVLLAGTFHMFVLANKMTTAANAIVLQFTAPVFLLVYSALLFHQKFRRGDVLAVVFTMCGIALFFFDQLAPGYLEGNFVAIGSGAVMAGMYLSVGRATNDSDRICGTLVGHWFTALAGLPMALFTDNPVTPAAIASILILGIFQLGIPYLLYSLATRTCPPLACSLLGAIEPLLNPVWVFLFAGERPGLFALFGGVIVILTVTLWCMWNGAQTSKVKKVLEQGQTV